MCVGQNDRFSDVPEDGWWRLKQPVLCYWDGQYKKFKS